MVQEGSEQGAGLQETGMCLGGLLGQVGGLGFDPKSKRKLVKSFKKGKDVISLKCHKDNSGFNVENRWEDCKRSFCTLTVSK